MSSPAEIAGSPVAMATVPLPQTAANPVGVSAADLAAVSRVVATVDAVVRSPAWRDRVLSSAPAIARHDPGYPGVLYGFDFHLSPRGPRLIEVNTNAGGALIVTRLLWDQAAQCRAGEAEARQAQAEAAERAVLASLLEDYRAARGEGAPRLVAIVDETPPAQYLYAEFLRFAEGLQALGIRTEVCDPRELEGGDAGLTLHGRPVDLVYNRLTDFYLEAEHLAPLRAAYASGAVVLTPHPYGHALYADKRNLADLSDPQVLSDLGVEPEAQCVLCEGIPATRRVDRAHAEALWSGRKSLFFKPAGGFGGRGAYQGAKLTRATFERLLDEDYVAQVEVSPSIHRAELGGEAVDLKVDLRAYCYRGEVQLFAARLYRGQTTNFRTPGGGFASVCVREP